MVTIVVAGITLHNAAADRQREIDALAVEAEAAGYTLDPIAFAAAYDAGKPEPNAADVYLEAYAALDAGDADTAIALTIEAAALPRARFPLRFGYEAPLPFDLALTRELSRDLSAALRAALERRDAAAARTLLDAQFALGESMHEAPLLILQAVRNTGLRRSLDDLAAVFAAGLIDGGWLIEIETRLESINLQPALADAAAAERAVAFEYASDLAAGRNPIARAYEFVTGAHEERLRSVLTAYGELLESANAPARFRAAELDRLLVLPGTLTGTASEMSESILIPSARILAIATHNEGLLAAALGACVIERYRIAERELPETAANLAALGLAMPDDPLGAGRIGYHRESDGYRVWSAGLDGLDDGGTPDSDDAVLVVGMAD